MPTQCEIRFDNEPDRVYYGGQMMSGRVTLTLTKEKTVRGISNVFNTTRGKKYYLRLRDVSYALLCAVSCIYRTSIYVFMCAWVSGYSAIFCEHQCVHITYAHAYATKIKVCVCVLLFSHSVCPCRHCCWCSQTFYVCMIGSMRPAIRPSDVIVIK